MSTEPADPLERFLFEKPQHLGLQAGHHLADLVEEHRAAVGRFQQSPLLPIRAGERAALVAEQLAFQQRLRQRRAGDVHERLRGAIAGVVNDLRREILAGSALAGQQHRRRRAGGDLLQQRAHADHDVALADDPLEAVGLRLAGAQRAHLAPQLRRLQRLGHEQRDLVDVERLVRVVIGAVLHRLDGVVDARIGGQEDDQRVRVVLLDLLEHREAVGVRQAEIEQHEIHAFAMALERLGGGFGLENAVALLAEPIGQRPANQLFVVDDEDGRRAHAPSIRSRRREDAAVGTVSRARHQIRDVVHLDRLVDDAHGAEPQRLGAISGVP